jgi:translation initiation factor IF-1
MPRNTVGGKNFKKFKTGTEGFRAKAAREAADDLLDLIIRVQKTPKERLSAEDREASHLLFAGRVVRRFGHGRMEVYCHDGLSRQCRIRGLLRKKGQVFIDIDSYVVVSLREATESSSEDETGLSTGAAIDDKTADIIGLFDDKQRVQLQKTQVNPRLFVTVGADGKEEQLDDMFDRSDLLEGMEDEAEEDSKLTKPKGRSQKGAVQTSMKEANVINDIDIDNI